MEFLKTHFNRKTISCWLFAALLFVLGWIAQHCQNYFYFNIGQNIPVEIYKITAQSLLILIPFVGTMVVFGMNRIKDAIKGELDLPTKENLKDGWVGGSKLFSSFSVYVSLVILLNLTLLVFHETIGLSLGILLADIGLVLGALYLVGGIAVKIFGVDSRLLTTPD